ncbi:response regulator transcription factor [Azonexus sp.]|uniref:response regulator transcription factor n=1 Tax=Azonexus sp. TaxID=1872668 RepID=UPI0027B8C142|nr:response regulator transcription factor [Azonexus sp.]
MNKPLHVAVVEDHDALREMTVAALDISGHLVKGYESAEALLEQSDPMSVDIAVLDVNLPGACGFTLAQRLRSENPSIGILMLTVRNAVNDKVRGYDSGADIYLPKPVERQELLAAVSALSRRVHPDSAINTAVSALSQGKAQLLHTFALDILGKLENMQVHESAGKVAAPEASSWRLSPDAWSFVDAAGNSMQLTAQERIFLKSLVDNACQAVSREDLVVAFGENPYEYDYHRLDALVSRLRKKATDQGVELPVRAVRGVGYLIT